MFTSTMTMIYSGAFKKQTKTPMNKSVLKLAFYYDKQKYRDEETSPKNIATEKPETWIIAYNKKFYQFEDISYNKGKQQKVLYLSRTSHSPGPYKPMQSINPLFFMFSFAFQNGEIRNIDIIKQSEVWLNLQKKVVGVNETINNGYRGITIKFKNIATTVGNINCEIFFAKEYDWYPIYSKATIMGIGQDVAKVTKIKKYKTNSGSIYIPLRIEGILYSTKGEILQTGIAEINPNSVKINQPIDKQIFTLSVPDQSKIYDNDLQ